MNKLTISFKTFTLTCAGPRRVAVLRHLLSECGAIEKSEEGILFDANKAKLCADDLLFAYVGGEKLPGCSVIKKCMTPKDTEWIISVRDFLLNVSLLQKKNHYVLVEVRDGKTQVSSEHSLCSGGENSNGT